MNELYCVFMVVKIYWSSDQMCIYAPLKGPFNMLCSLYTVFHQCLLLFNEQNIFQTVSSEYMTSNFINKVATWNTVQLCSLTKSQIFVIRCAKSANVSVCAGMCAYFQSGLCDSHQKAVGFKAVFEKPFNESHKLPNITDASRYYCSSHGQSFSFKV